MINHELDVRVEEEVMLRVPCDHWCLFLPGDVLSGSVWIKDRRDLCEHERCYPRDNPADYSGSLDAAWQMEEEIKRRGDIPKLSYLEALDNVLGNPPLDEPYLLPYSIWSFIHATPGQRCRAAREAAREK